MTAGDVDRARDEAPAATADADRAPRGARVLVAALLVLLLVPGVVGFDLWPLTGWRLFSLSRDADQTRWVLEAVDATGDRRVVSLEELPLRYRHAEWPMAELPGASAATGRTRRPTAGAVETQAIASARGASAGSEPS